jgi:dolichol-phosphate mannosyltransferase
MNHSAATKDCGPPASCQVLVVLPAYNEEARIESLLNRIDEVMKEAALPYHIILVNDGSQDGTTRIVNACSERMPLRMIQHKVNLGLGATIRDGLMAAAESATARAIIVTMDADGTHPPELILRMTQMIREGCDVVIASRYQPASKTVGVPLSRRLLSGCASWVLRILFPTKGVRDFTCGFRAYRAQVIKEAITRYGKDFSPRAGFECMMDILLDLRKMNLIFGEVPIVLRYDLKQGGTKMKIGLTACKSLALIVRRRLGH